MMIGMFDKDHSGTINFQEFQVRRPAAPPRPRTPRAHALPCI